MKKVLLILIAVFLFVACSHYETLQGERCRLDLIGIDTLYRWQGNIYKYTWYDVKNKITYEEYSSESYYNSNNMIGIIRK